MSHRVFTGSNRVHPLLSRPVTRNTTKSDFVLNFTTANNGNLETPSEREPILKDPRLLLKNLAGSVLCFLASISAITFILIPQLLKSLNQAHSIVSEATVILAGTLSAALLLILSFSWLIRSLMEYFTARELDLAGIRVTGSIMDKWVEETDNGLTYLVRYSYMNNLNAKQVINRHIFLQLERGDMVIVVHQVDRPLVSRLVIS